MFRLSSKQSVSELLQIAITAAFVTLLSSYQVLAQPREVTWDDLKELKDGEVPKNSKAQILGGLFDKGSYEIMVYTPRAQAARYASAAKENYITLDSASYNPGMFNRYVAFMVTNLLTSSLNISGIKPDDIRRIGRGIIVVGEDIHEADSALFVEGSLKNLYGAQYTYVDAVFYFPLSLFNGQDDMKIVIFDNKGKVERKLKKKDIQKLE